MNATVRTAVKSSKPARRFGEGILATVPSYRLDCTIEDYDWWAAQASREEDRELDRMAAVAAYEARYDGWF